MPFNVKAYPRSWPRQSKMRKLLQSVMAPIKTRSLLQHGLLKPKWQTTVIQDKLHIWRDGRSKCLLEWPLWTLEYIGFPLAVFNRACNSLRQGGSGLKWCVGHLNPVYSKPPPPSLPSCFTLAAKNVQYDPFFFRMPTDFTRQCWIGPKRAVSTCGGQNSVPKVEIWFVISPEIHPWPPPSLFPSNWMIIKELELYHIQYQFALYIRISYSAEHFLHLIHSGYST